MMDLTTTLAEQIRASETSHEPVETILATDERVLARITDGIYRQPSSALRELISNAYDADATEVVILTDAPRFGQIAVRDNGQGLTPEVLEHLVGHIGGSAKRSEEGKDLGVTAADNEDYSPGGRKLIGKLGIGLFSVAQFTRHFLIITKTKGDSYRTVADITLGPVAGSDASKRAVGTSRQRIRTGQARIWREYAEDKDSHGTQIELLELLPRTRAELASEDQWAKIEFDDGDEEAIKVLPPKFHIGRMQRGSSGMLSKEPQLPWTETDAPRRRFERLVDAVLRTSTTMGETVDLDELCDRYLQTLWTLALSAPLEYVQIHPFDLVPLDDMAFYELENAPRGQAREIDLEINESPRKHFGLTTPNGSGGIPFDVFVDGVQLCRPIVYKGLPKASTALQTPLLFVGQHSQDFSGKPIELSGGPLEFEAYLFWAPRIVPKQHQGVIIRVGNASGALFDRTFLGYQISEQNRLRQITAEVFVKTGLDGAINLDRESFNYAHPHYQYLVRWIHSALRQLANRQKGIGSSIRSQRLREEGETIRADVSARVAESLRSRGVKDLPSVLLLDSSNRSRAPELRAEGTIAIRREAIIPASTAIHATKTEAERRKTADAKAIAIVQLLHGWGLLSELSFDEQEHLVRDILEIMMAE